MTNFLNWKAGRLGEGYFKMLLIPEWFSKLFKFDIYLIWFKSGSRIESHLDPIDENYEHHRLNITLKDSKWGGIFYKDTSNIRDRIDINKKIIKFRPDIEIHGQSLNDGTKVVLSIGWLKKKKKPIHITGVRQ